MNIHYFRERSEIYLGEEGGVDRKNHFFISLKSVHYIFSQKDAI